MSMHHICAWYPRISEEIVGFPAVIDGFKSPCGYLKLNQGPLEEQLISYLLRNFSSTPEIFLKIKTINFYFTIYVSVWNVHGSVHACGEIKRALDALELDSKWVVRILMWVLECELVLSGRQIK